MAKKKRPAHRKSKSASRKFHSVKLSLETLEQRQLLSVNPVISEFMAANSTTLTDYYGKNPDWLEIFNPDSIALNFSGWKLKDNSTVWTIPANVTIPAQSYLKIICDSRDLVAPNGELHASFKLGASGDYLGLLKPDNTVVSEFAPQYPPQYTDVSYGLVVEQTSTPIISAGAGARVLVPTTTNGGDTLGAAWQGADSFDDSSWTAATTGVGSLATVSPTASTNLKLRLNADTQSAMVTDTSGVNHHGTNVNNTVSWLATARDTATEPLTRSGVMQFNAYENDQITVASSSADFQSATAGTIAFWMSSTGATGAGADGATLFDLRSTKGMLITQTDGGQIRVRCYQTSGSTSVLVTDVTSNVTVSDSQWHHVAVNFTQTAGSLCSIYIDGVFDKSAANGSLGWGWASTYPIEIGRCTNHTPAPKNYNGLLDDFRFYNASLSAAQIAGIAKGADESVVSAAVGFNVQTQLVGVNTSAFIRIPFNIADPNAIDNLLLTIQHNDGFIAWINGQQVASENAPDSPEWNSAATDAHSPGRTRQCLIDDLEGLLQAGTNILAIQGLNNSLSDPSFLILPQLSANVTATYGVQGRYFVKPTPGSVNYGGTSDLGPMVSNVSEPATQPSAGQPIVVTAKVSPTLSPVQASTVNLYYCVMYGSDQSLRMYDDGAHGDGANGDGIFGAAIPAGTATAGQMLRWYVSAADTAGHLGRWPLQVPVLGDDAGPVYVGTVIADPALTSTLPILQTFIVNPAAADNWSDRTGTRGSVYYLGQFYDNVFVRCRGGYTTRGNKIKFNSGYDFTFAADQDPVTQINLNLKGIDANYQDNSNVRATLAFETLSDVGAAASIAFPMRVQRNNAYYGVMTFIETFDKHLLKREGKYENGAIYKGYTDTMTSAASPNFRKENREEIAGTDDLQQFLNGLHLTDPVARRNFIYDNVNIPESLDYLVAQTLYLDNDAVSKNYYLYCDTNDGANTTYGYANPNGTNEWAMVPWDKDLTFGKNYFWADYSTVDPQAHPCFGDSLHPKLYGPANYFIDVLLDIPEIKQMYLRRLRTAMDELLQPPGTPYSARFYENRLDELYAKLTGDPVVKNSLGNLQTYFNDIKTKYFDPRRTHLYVDHSLNSGYADYAGIPPEQAQNLSINFGSYEVSPASNNQDQEYLTLVNPNSVAVDLSGWKLTGGINYTFPKGVVIPAGGTLYVSPNVYAFRQRTIGPSGSQSLFVVGNYDGRLSMWGEAVQLVDLRDTLVATLTTPVNPSAAQQFLRITEVMYHPAEPMSGSYTSDDFQFIELKNTSAAQTISLTGVRFTDGIAFDFTGGSVTSLAPGARVLVVSNLTAFQSRYGTSLNGIIAGQFAKADPADLSVTHLSKSGEKVTLVDAVGETIQSFSYQDDWYKQSDGSGNSLVIRDAAAADRSLWNQREGWFASHAANGSPGTDETPDYAVDAIVVSELLSHTDAANPGDWVEFYNTTAAPIPIGGWYLSDNDADLKKYQIAAGTVIPAYGYVTFNHHDHFGNTSDPGFRTEFSFDEYGGTVYLTSASGGALTTYQTSQKFEDNDRDRDGTYPYHGNTSVTFSFERYTKSTGGADFVETQQSTYNDANTPPRVGPVVINEASYNPTPGNASYIELKNLTAQAVSLYDPDHADPLNPSKKNAWKLSGGIDFVFPQGAAIPANGYALVVDTDPSWFRTRYGVPASVPIYGSYLHELGNGSDSIELKRAGEPDASPLKPVPYYRVDKVTYEDGGLWPKAADGFRASLNRVTAAAYGNDPANWTAGRPTPGAENAAFVANPITLTTPASATVGTNKTQNLAVLAASTNGNSTLLYDWSVLSMPAGATYPTFSVNDTNAAKNTTATFYKCGSYSIVVRITDTSGATLTSIVNAIVTPVATGICILPGTPQLLPTSKQQFTAMTADQFGNRMSGTPVSATWSIVSGGGSITADGLYTTGGPPTATIKGQSGSYSGTATVLVAYPQDYWKFDETSGLTAADAIGSHNATLSGGCVWTDGVFGNGLTFDGSTGSASASINMNDTTAAISLWFKTTSPNVGLFEVRDAGATRDRCLYLSGGNVVAYLYSSESIASSGLNLADGQWHNLIFTYGSAISGERLYVDGILRAAGTKTSSNFTTDNRITIGYTDFAAQPYFQGTIDDVRIYAVALSAGNAAYLASVPPTDLTLSNATVTENRLAAVIGTLATTDLNPLDSCTYVLQNDPSGKFEITDSTLKLKAGQSLDFETTPSVALAIRSYNSAGAYFEQTLTITVIDAIESMIVASAHWAAVGTAGMTLKLADDGKLHVYQSGTTTDIIPPHASASVSYIGVTGRSTGDVFTVDSMGAGVPNFTIRNATLTISQNDAIPATTNVTIDAGVLDFGEYTDSIGDLLIKNDGQVTIPAISNHSTTVELGTLTVSSINCDTLSIGLVQSSAGSLNSADTAGAAITKNAVQPLVVLDLSLPATPTMPATSQLSMPMKTISKPFLAVANDLACESSKADGLEEIIATVPAPAATVVVSAAVAIRVQTIAATSLDTKASASVSQTGTNLHPSPAIVPLRNIEDYLASHFSDKRLADAAFNLFIIRRDKPTSRKRVPEAAANMSGREHNTASTTLQSAIENYQDWHSADQLASDLIRKNHSRKLIGLFLEAVDTVLTKE